MNHLARLNSFTLFIILSLFTTSCGIKKQEEASFKSEQAQEKNLITSAVSKRLAPLSNLFSKLNELTMIAIKNIHFKSDLRLSKDAQVLMNNFGNDFFFETILKYDLGEFSILNDGGFNFNYQDSNINPDFAIIVQGKFKQEKIETASVILKKDNREFNIITISDNIVRVNYKDYFKFLINEKNKLSASIGDIKIEANIELKTITITKGKDNVDFIIDNDFIISIEELDIKFENFEYSKSSKLSVKIKDLKSDERLAQFNKNGFIIVKKAKHDDETSYDIEIKVDMEL